MPSHWPATQSPPPSDSWVTRSWKRPVCRGIWCGCRSVSSISTTSSRIWSRRWKPRSNADRRWNEKGLLVQALFLGSSRISGEGGLDLQKEVINVAVSVSHAFDHFDLVIDPFKLAGMHWPAHSGQDASPVRLQY